jgi:hypothetical protein
LGQTHLSQTRLTLGVLLSIWLPNIWHAVKGNIVSNYFDGGHRHMILGNTASVIHAQNVKMLLELSNLGTTCFSYTQTLLTCRVRAAGTVHALQFSWSHGGSLMKLGVQVYAIPFLNHNVGLQSQKGV